MGIEDHLRPDEVVISELPPFYLTSFRILNMPTGGLGEAPSQLPLEQITGIELIRASSHPMMISGTLMSLMGVVLASLGLYISAILIVPAGIGIVIAGGMGTSRYFQLRTSGAARQDESLWRLHHQKSRSLIASLQNIIGEKLRQ